MLADIERRPDAPGHTFVELNLLEDPALAERYAEEIPVVLIDGAQHAYWRVDAARLRAALSA